jgi:sec-independent protein translocase protein TatC
MAALRNTQSADDKRMELTEHLGELRTHIIRAMWYLFLGALIGYYFFGPLYGAMYRPLERELSQLNLARQKKIVVHGTLTSASGKDVLVLPKALHDPPSREEFQQLIDAVEWVHEHPSANAYMGIIFKNFYEPFTVKVTIGVIFGLLLTSPLVVREFALFLMPALTPAERKPLRVLVPLSAILLLCGMAVAYATMFYAMGWFLSNDPMSWALMCGPLLILYFGSILLVMMVEKSRVKPQSV